MLAKQNTAIIFSLLISVLLTLIPLPIWAEWGRPALVALLLIYWLVALPFSISLGIAWLLGLLLDMLNGTLLGEHALAMAIVTFVTLKVYRQLRVFPLWQQSLCIFLLISIYQLVIFIVQGLSGQYVTNALFWATPITSMLLWPWLFVLLRHYRRRFSI